MRNRKVSVNLAVLYRVGVLAAVLALPAQAHHGVAPHYDDGTQVMIDGTVAEFQFINPHSFVYLRVVGTDGKEAIWHCEMASRSVLPRFKSEVATKALPEKKAVAATPAPKAN